MGGWCTVGEWREGPQGAGCTGMVLHGRWSLEWMVHSGYFTPAMVGVFYSLYSKIVDKLC